MILESIIFEKEPIPNGITVNCTIKSEGVATSATVPFGTSAGKHEVSPFSMFGIDAAIKNFPKLDGMRFKSLAELEKEILKHDNDKFPRIGGNLVLSLSIAFLRLKAALAGKELYQLVKGKGVPNPLSKVVGGGKHAPHGPEFQEFLVYSKKPLEEAISINREFHDILGKELKSKQLDLEGGWVVNLDENKILEKISNLRDDSFPGLLVGVDIAASSFYNKSKYFYKSMAVGSSKQFEYILSLIKDFKLFYVEDPFHEDDFDNFAKLQKAAKNCLVCGDDLLVTSPERLKKSLELGSCRAAIVKPNQIALLSKMFEFVSECRKNRVEPVFSHRSKESYDDYLSDLSIGTKIMKVGIVGRERSAKLERLLSIKKKL